MNTSYRTRFLHEVPANPNAQYVSLILIILAIFIALIRLKSTVGVEGLASKQFIASYNFATHEKASANRNALAAYLKSHDVGADIVVYRPAVSADMLAEVTRNLLMWGVPLSALSIIGVPRKQEGIEVRVFRVLNVFKE